MKPNFKKNNLALLVLGAAVLFAGCGSSAKPTTIPMSTAAQQSQPDNIGVQMTADAGPFDINYQYDPYYWSIVKGTYAGTIQGWLGENQNLAMSQAFSLTLGTQTQDGLNAAIMRFASAGDVSINFTRNMTPGMVAQRFGSFIHFSFVSERMSLPQLSDLPVAMVVDLAFSGVNSLDPAHSSVYLIECGFSQGPECSGDTLSNVWFLRDLRKR